jgi:hypothetical protein
MSDGPSADNDSSSGDFGNRTDIEGLMTRLAPLNEDNLFHPEELR